jgi:2-hydroxy-3-oxopropionate reductase
MSVSTAPGRSPRLCNQMLMVAAIQAVAEALHLSRAAGAIRPGCDRLWLGGSAGSRVLEVMGGRMVDRDFVAGVEARLHHKDYRIVIGEAHRLGVPLPVAAQVDQQLNALMAQGWGRADTASLLRVLEAAGQCS